MNRVWETFVHDSTVLVVCGGLFAVLAIGTLSRLIAAAVRGRQVGAEQKASLITWWWLAAALVAAILLGRFGVSCLFLAASCLAVREFISLALRDQHPRLLWGSCCVMIAVHYLLILGGSNRAALVFLPLAGFVASNLLSMWWQKPADFLTAAARLPWGLLLAAYCPSHAVMLFNLEPALVGSPARLILYLVIMTELNDIAQALVGRSWGQRPVAPVISPKKTWEGFLGGALVTTIVATALAPWMTPFGPPPPSWAAGKLDASLLWPALLGLLISVSGLLGDLTVSAIKRNVGVKDSSQLLPGQGGMLDRIDSLTLTAPAVYYFTILLP